MRLLEEVVSVDPGKEAVGSRLAKPEDFYFQGHFPQDPIVPAIILVELVAQVGGLAAGAPSPGEEPRPLQLRVAAIGPFKFPSAARPGARLEASARVAGSLGRLYKIDGSSHCRRDSGCGGKPDTRRLELRNPLDFNQKLTAADLRERDGDRVARAGND